MKTLIVDYLIRILISVLPVIVFLIALMFLDSYKLIRFRTVLLTVCLGFGVAFACLSINDFLLELLGLGSKRYVRYVSPIVEEVLKAGYIVFLISSKRVGFMVDGAIRGFAIGTGFAIVENVIYSQLPDLGMFTWIIRGFGTAVMHGGATALFGIISKDFSDRHESSAARIFLPGMLIAIIIHSAYNHIVSISPVLSSVGIVIGLPLIMLLVFQQSERLLKRWLGIGFDTDSELFEMITSGNITETRIGKYLISLKSSYPGEVVADMLCLLRIHLELSIRAKGLLLMREAGFEAPPDPEIKEKFQELNYLEKSIGKTGRLTIMPFLRWSSHDLWQLYMLGKR